MALPLIPAPVTALVRGRRARGPAAPGRPTPPRPTVAHGSLTARRPRAAGRWLAARTPRGRSGTTAVLLAAVLWGTAGPAASLDVVSPPAAHAGAVRSLLGAAALVGVVVMTGQMGALRRLLGPDRWRWLLGAAGAVAAFQVTFFAGVQQLGVALGTVVALGSAPVVGGLVRALRTGTPPSGRWMLATTLAIGGVGVLLLPGAEAVADPVGIALAVAAGSAFAGYTMASSSASQRGDPPLATTAAAFLASAVVLAPLLTRDDAGWLASPAGLGVALWLGVATAAVPYGLYAMGLRRVASHRALTLSLADPLTAALLGVVVLGESLGWLGGLGLLLVIAGLLLAVWPAPAPRPHTRALAAIPAHAETTTGPGPPRVRTDDPIDEPADEPTGDPIDEPADEPSDEPADEPSHEPAEPHHAPSGHGRLEPRAAPISATLQASAAPGTAGLGAHDDRTDHGHPHRTDPRGRPGRGAHR